MEIKFAKDIIKEIESRRQVEIPEGYITGEAFENWLYQEESENDDNIK